MGFAEWAIGMGAIAGLAAGGGAYAALSPGSQLFGPTLIAPRRAGELALTFDDGPSPAWTPRLLEFLAEQDIRATFFLLGSRAQAQAWLVRRIAGGGHLVGNHSWSHPNLAFTPPARIREELSATRDQLQQITGVPVRFFRPPFGARRPAALRIARELGMTPVLWNAMTSDWSDPAAARIARQLTAKIDRLTRRGWAANVVLHDGGHLDPAAHRGPSLHAAELLVVRYKPSHRFVTVDAWD
jgi:peptidoglycan/xylan/chitin deacetylase (PgdA/CDA1 family)